MLARFASCCRGYAASGEAVLGVTHPGDSFGVPLAGVMLAATAAGASVIDCKHQSRHFVLDNGVTGVRIDGLSLINGRVSAGEGDDALGGCMLVGEDASLHLRNVTFRNCSAPGAYYARDSGSGEERARDRGSGRQQSERRRVGRERRRMSKRSVQNDWILFWENDWILFWENPVIFPKQNPVKKGGNFFTTFFVKLRVPLGERQTR